MPRRLLLALSLTVFVAACDGSRRQPTGSGSGRPSGSTCGNGQIDASETCDGTQLGGATCTSLGRGTGSLRCSSSCTSFDTSGCQAPPAGRCGNGTIESGEACDGAQLGGASCASIGAGSGTLACAAGCVSFDPSGCSGQCQPSCGTRACGQDPICGASCGTCGAGQCQNGNCAGGRGSAPRILSLTVNNTTLTPGNNLVVSAVVTDPDGIDDLIGGQLEAPGGGTYGAFATAAQEGAYSLTLTWIQINSVAPVRGVAPSPDRQRRTFRARFFDVAGNVAVLEIEVELTCTMQGHVLCGGGCVNAVNDRFNCGECMRSCAQLGINYYGDADGLWCQQGECFVLRITDANDSRTCDEICADVGLMCDPNLRSTAMIHNCSTQNVGCTGTYTIEGLNCMFRGMSCGCRG